MFHFATGEPGGYLVLINFVGVGIVQKMVALLYFFLVILSGFSLIQQAPKSYSYEKSRLTVFLCCLRSSRVLSVLL